MRNELATHRLAYSILVILLLVFGTAIFGAWPNRELQRILIAGLSISYCIWGVVTHVKSQFLTPRVVIEYVVVSLFAGMLLELLTI
jgi:hypothetical protein